ncbi:MAG TPA: SEC-C metal-binding domain-containing protein, partial [Candidatus Hydrogenedentes bacterium]|nr:SEC-C metal-binding domain-containing protein [Candidatus Hydrogenedentota bacterium]
VQPEEGDLEGLATAFRKFYGFEPDITGGNAEDPAPLAESLLKQAIDEYLRREDLIAEEIRHAFHEQIGGDDSYVDFKKLARKRVHDLEMMALLRAVDDKWIDHLYSMDYLRESVRLRAYGQKDPLIEYKTEGYEIFQAMMKSIEENVTQTLFRLTDPEVRRTRQIQARRGMLTAKSDPFAQLSQYSYVAADKEQDRSFASYDTSRFALAGQPSEAQGAAPGESAPKPKPRPIRVGPKINPNDKCPCGSGKKYKKCCGAQSDN